MNIKIVFNRFKKEEGECPIHFDLIFSRKERVYLHTGVKVNKIFWNENKKTIKKDHESAYTYNHRIRELKNKILNWENKQSLEGKPVNKKTFLEFIQGKAQESQPFVSFLREFLYSIEGDLNPRSFQRYISALKQVEKFDSSTTVENIDNEWVNKYHNFLLQQKQKESTQINHIVAKRALKKAVQIGILQRNPYEYPEKFKIPQSKSRIVYLTTEELELIRKYKPEDKKLALTKDLFLFQCNTGMGYSDMQDLRKEDLQKGYIQKERIKTKTMQNIMLLPEANEILKKYSGNPDAFALPRIALTTYQGRLVSLREKCGIETHITTHVARHTFATLMLGKGLPLETVSHILGHRSIQTTQVYAKMVFKKIEADFTRLKIKGI